MNKEQAQQELLKLGIKPHMYEYKLFSAVDKDDELLLQLLIDAGTDMNVTDLGALTPLMYAMFGGDRALGCIRLLCRARGEHSPAYCRI